MGMLDSVLCIGKDHFQLGQLSGMDELSGTIEWCDDISDDIINSGWLQKNAIEFAEILKENPYIDGSAFAVWLDREIDYLKDRPLSDLIRKFKYDYVGWYRSEEHFAEDHIRQMCDIPEWIFNVIDLEKLAGYLLEDGYVYLNGYVFVK